MTDPHTQFFEDPESNAAHLETCAECRAIFERLDLPISHAAIRLDQLPLAEWEGASYRSWGYAVACAAAVLIIAVALCRAVGISPLRAVTLDGSLTQWRTFLGSASAALRAAAIGWQIVFVCVVVAVNAVLVLLLRRPPRGIDA